MSVARFGEPFVTEEISDIALATTFTLDSLFVPITKMCLKRAVFRDVQITIPASPSFVPYRDYIGSNIETLDIENGLRKTLYHSPESLQAPNWTPDGRH